MANWAKLQETLTSLPVVKRAKHGIHFDNGDGTITANFSGKPCHYQDTDGLWKPIDTGLLLAGDGWYGSPHSDVKIHPNGQVKVTGSDYSQFTKLPSAKKGVLAGDRIIRTFPGGEQHLIMTEDGFRQEIHVEKPTFPLEKFIARQTGNLPSKYIASPLTAMDADGNSYVFTGNVAESGDWLDGAVYPVTIDPDFAGSTADCTIYGSNADWATARSTSAGYSTAASGKIYLGCRNTFRVNRTALLFDTSSIEDAVTVTQVNLKIYVTDDDSGADFTVLIVKYDWSAYAANLSNATNRETAYDGILAATQETNNLGSTAGGYTGAKTSGNLDTTWVNKTGFTYYGLLSSRDYNNTTPTNSYEQIGIGASENATESYRPVLSVTYTAAATGALRRTNMNAQMQSLTGGFN